jgi:ABC-type transport system involved in multi-copper enzyme maturation permease subunit
MLQFFAILKDSFHEAVDGFVIYAMLGMSLLVIVIVGSMSFTPAEPQQAFDKIVSSREFTRVYKLRVTVTGRSLAGTINGKPDLTRGDTFRQTVALWAKRPETIKAAEIMGKQKGGGNKDVPNVEISLDREATAEEQKAVSNADMEAFLKNQFLMMAGMDATATRVTTGVEEPTYAFDVTTSGGSSVRGWPHTTKIFFGAVTITDETSLGRVLYTIEDQIINGLGGALALLIGLIITSFFIPNMLRKGSVDLFISKPIGRSQLLIYKYIGGLTFVFLVTSFTIGGIWLVIALRSGFWDPSFLAVIPILTFTFAIIYAMSTFVAVFTRSAIASMILSIGFMLFLYIVGQVKTLFDVFRMERADRMPEWSYTLVDTLNNVLPRYKDLDKLTSKMIAEGTLTQSEIQMSPIGFLQLPSWTGTFGVSLIFIALMLALSCWRFNKRDY